MKLKSIEINGFKSFAEKIKLNFESNITAIIGPNGSGKSNVADAIRWVLGEQSAKSLRGNKMEDIIFSGTDDKVRKNYSIVSITFDNSDNLIPIDFKEVSISRKLYRTGESEYFINKANVKLKEIRELFLDTGIGKEGYSIIGQGKVEEIINGKSEERRIIFEEASGISKIKYQKNESQKKLIKAKDNLIRLKDIINNNEKNYQFLKEQSDKAKRGIEILKKIEKAEFSNAYKEYSLLTNNFDKFSKILKIDKEELIDIDKEIEALKLKINPLNEEIDNTKKLIDKYSNDLTNISNRKNELSNKKNILTERNKYIKLSNEQYYKLNQEYSDSIKSINIEISEKEKNILEKELMLKGYISKKNKLKEELSNNVEILNSKSSYLDNLVSEKLKIENILNNLESEKKANEIIKDNIKKKKEKQFEEISRLNNEKLNFEKILLKNKKLLDSYLKEIEIINENIIQSENNFNDLEKELIYLNNENININNEITYKIKEAEMLKNYINNHEGYSKSVQDLFKLFSSENEYNKMICGTLGDLIYVDDKYKKAIDTVLSSNLQSIIVNNDLDAKKIIDKMKESKIGRVNFLPISKIFHKKEVNRISDNAVLSFANDVIKCDNKYKNIINYFLSNTIICDNLDTALELSNKYLNKFRIVTLDGDIINSWGSMSGGYRSYKNSFSIIGRKNKLDSILSEVNKLKSNFNENLSKISNIDNDLKKYENIIKNFKLDLDNLTLKIDSIRKLIFKNEFDVNNISQKINELSNYYENYQIYDSDKENQLNLCIEKNNLLENKIKNLNSEIFEIKDSILKLEKDEIFVINSLDSLERDISILINFKNNLFENKISIENKFNLKEKEITESSIDFENNLKEITNIEKIIDDLDFKILETSKLLNENKEFEKKILSDKENLLKKYYDLNEKHLTLDKDIEKNELRISNFNGQISNIINKLSNDYSLNYEECKERMILYKSENFSKAELSELKDKIKEIGSFSYDSIEEFKKVKSELEFQKSQEKDLQNSIDDINKIILKLENTMKSTFIQEFKNINNKFSSIFKILFNGGDARLELDSDDILNCGINIVAKPVGKKMQTLSLLSGGEKSLTAVALLFAIFETKPSPFCILDEIDAALDDSNILRYVEYLKTYLMDTQFIIVTHRKPTMEMADMIYGVTMEQKGISKIVSMKFNKEN